MPITSQASVILRGPGDPVIVCGKEKSKLTRPQYDVIKALLAAGEDGLSKDKLDECSSHNYAYKILQRLRDSDPDWAKVIQMADRAWGRYRIRLSYQPG
jgi:hypothetical protein